MQRQIRRQAEPGRCSMCVLPGRPCEKFQRGLGAKGEQCVNCAHFKECHQRKHKYGAKRCELDGHKFASQRERDRYAELKLLEKSGAIKHLRLQPEYPLEAHSWPDYTDGSVGVEVCKYIADFEYEEQTKLPEMVRRGDQPIGMQWTLVTEDAKGAKTPVYRLKAKWFEACYGRKIRET